MKLQLLPLLVSLWFPRTATISASLPELCLRPQKTSLSGWLHLPQALDITRLIAHLPPAAGASSTSHLLKLITQTPNNL
jgi:hypothetical protein